MRAVVDGVVIAECDQTVVVEGNHYFPPESVRPEYLVDSATHSLCPWKGVASYKTIAVTGHTINDGAWFYPKPSPLARRIKGRMAFWKGVTVEPSPTPPDERCRER